MTTMIASFTQGCKLVPVRVEVDIVFEKTLEHHGSLGCILPREPRKTKRMLLAESPGH